MCYGGRAMISLRKTFYFKTISIVLIALFLFQADVLYSLSQGEKLDEQFKNAKEDYIGKNFDPAAVRLERLAAAYENVKSRTSEIERKHGEALLLLGACQENLNKDEKIIIGTYNRAKDKLGNEYAFSDLDLGKLQIYKKVFPKKAVETIGSGKIEIETPQRVKKKKFPWLLVAGSAVVVIALIFFLGKKKSQKKLTIILGEGVSGNPFSGTYTHNKNAIVDYSYNAQNGYTSLIVRLDGIVVSNSGTIKMDKDHTLEVSASKQYTLTVNRGTGVTGSPDTGPYYYKDGDSAYYNYSLQTGYKNLVVKLDGIDVSASGQITMNTNHSLTSSATATSVNVKITNPKSGDVLSGTVNIQATASGDNSIREVIFYADDSSIGNDAASPYICAWDTTKCSNGAHKIKAVAYDIQGKNSTTEISVSLNNKVGTITGVTIKFLIVLAAANLQTTQQIQVDGVTKINKTFDFDVHYSDKEGDAKTFNERIYNLTRPLGAMQITQIADLSYSKIFPTEEIYVWPTKYEIVHINHTWTGGIDPGEPVISPNSFSLNVAPWNNDIWLTQQTITVNISAPSPDYR